MAEEEKGASRPRDADADDGAWVEDISDTVAPSIGPHSTIRHLPQRERTASDVDAMGQDKRRRVVGRSYGPSFARQAVLYLAFLVAVAAVALGIKLLVDKYDQPPDHFQAKAPWAQPGVHQIQPKPLQ